MLFIYSSQLVKWDINDSFVATFPERAPTSESILQIGQ